MKDAEWIADLVRHGLVRASFVPPATRVLRELVRHRKALVGTMAAERNRTLKLLESAVNEIVAKRMNKKQQIRWSRATVQPFLDVRTAVGGAERHARGRLPLSPPRLPARQR